MQDWICSPLRVGHFEALCYLQSLPFPMKTQLSSILPVWKACEILGEDIVERIVTSLVRLRETASPQNRKLSAEDLTALIRSLFFNNATESNALDEQEPTTPPHIATAWKRWSTSKSLQLDKQTLLPFLVPQVIQPTSGGGHMGLFDCIVYSLQSSVPYATAQSSILLPDVLIFLAIATAYRRRSEETTPQSVKKIIWSMSQLSFRIYDSYLRKGVVNRDTVQRFLTDIYGEDTVKNIETTTILDRIFDDAAKTSIVTEQQFCIGCSVEGEGNSMLLLDWLADLCRALVPLPKLPPSTEEYLEQMHSTRPPNLYGLKDTYEIKRRFHSLVQTASVIHGDPMRSTLDRPSAAIITKEAFCRAVCEENKEMGSGGYLPESVASRVFGDEPWNLMKLFTFGGTAVREADDTALLKLVFDMFSEANIMSRSQVQAMIVSLLQHAQFRDLADRPQIEEVHKQECGDEKFPLCFAVNLGLMDPKATSSPSDLVAVEDLVGLAMRDKDQWDFNDFKDWNQRTGDSLLGGLGPLMMELKLIAAVQFGIPPLNEFLLIGEINRRHNRRYPRTDVARRGPRGTIWYVIDATWLKDWSANVSDQSANKKQLPKILNTKLLVENGSLQLRPEIRWRCEYELLPPLSWSALSAWYDGGPPIQRSVVKFTSSRSHSNNAPLPTEYEIEMYPYFVSIYLSDTASGGEARPFQQNYQLSRVSPVFNVLVNLCKELDIDNPDASARIWVLEDDGDDWILELEKSIFDQRKKRGLKNSDNECSDLQLLLELKDIETGTWPRGADGKAYRERQLQDNAQTPSTTSLGDGVVGLYNMGNTCYLNSSMQCLSHTPILREYFTSKAYFRDVNRTNPMGYEGKLAQVSAVLINEIWKRSNPISSGQPRRSVTAPGIYSPLTNAPALTPKTFRDSLGKFNDLFAGNEQHDAQELLAFLLGGLSEDLNRIVEKPYMEAPDSDGRPDRELADIWWSNHLKRERSIIVALFTGQYKSLLTCRTCKYESARFEPFSFLQLPLPDSQHLQVNLTYYSPEAGIAPLKYCVRAPNDGTLLDVLKELARLLIADETDTELVRQPSSEESIPQNDEAVEERANNMAIAVIREGYIGKVAPNDLRLQDQQIKESGELPHLHVYGLKPKETCDPEHRYLCISQRRSDLLSRDFLHPLSHRVFGIPLLLRFSENESFTGREIYDYIASRLQAIVPKGAVAFLNQQHKPNPLSSPGREEMTTADMEIAAAGPVPRYGFRLRRTSRDGRRCSDCQWYDCCIGCLIPDDDSFANLSDIDTLAVDWHFAVDIATNGFGYRMPQSDPTITRPLRPARVPPPVVIESHKSCGSPKKSGNQQGAITLDDCLEAFAKEEKIPEAYCSRCRDFRVQTKRMSLWRLPPVMIIHLKRFQFTPTMRRKLQELVVFPTEGLDLSRILASTDRPPPENTNGVNGEHEEREDHDDGSLYDLYAVVHHQGALSGGHYVASLKSEVDGQWRLFNDAQIFEIHAREVVDPSAYILFYIRRDVAKAQLSDYWDVSGDNPLSDEDMDDLLKGRSDRCTIS